MIPFAAPQFGPLPTTNFSWKRTATHLATNPGQWAAVGTCQPNYGMDRRRLASYGIEARRITVGDTTTVWARYIGVTAACEQPANPIDPDAPLVNARRRHTMWSWGQVTTKAVA